MNYYTDALQLEVSILEALLQRNRCGHGRTKYFQRASMALRSCLKANLLDLGNTVDQWKAATEERQQNQLVTRKKKRKRPIQKNKDEFWDLSTIRQEEEEEEDTTAVHDNSSRIQSLQHTIQFALKETIPQVISRMEHASDPLFLEIQRGFFVPFCTVALGALARIRVVLMRMGHCSLDVLQKVEQQSTDVEDVSFCFTPTELQTLREQFTESSSSSSGGGEQTTMMGMNASRSERLAKLRESLGINDAKRQPPASATTTTNMDDSSHGTENAANKQQPEIAPSDDELGEQSSSKIQGAATKNEKDANINNKSSNTVDNDDDDLGEAVRSSLTESTSGFGESEGTASVVGRKGVSSTSTTTSKAVSESIKANKKKKKRDKKEKEGGLPAHDKQQSSSEKKKKRSLSPPPPPPKGPSGGNSSSDPKKEKKKKRKKKDFFDNLFD